MKPKLSIQNIPVYQPGKSLEEVKREYGLDQVIKLASNENPFGCSQMVWEEVIGERDSLHLYPEDTSPRLREVVAEHLEVDPRRLIFGNGSDEIVQMIARAYLEPGSKSVMATPTFPRYETLTRIEGATAIEIPLKTGKHDLEAMIEAIDEQTRVVWICNPNNPTGTIVTEDELEDFLNRVPEHVLIVLDEAYYEYVQSPQFPDSISLLDYNPRILILRTFSKIYGIPSLRVGYGIGHPEVIGQLHRVREPFNVNRIAQTAAVAATKDQDFVTYCRNQNRIGMKQITQSLDDWGLFYYPSQANFLLIDTSYPAHEVFQYLLRCGVIVRSGEALGFPTSIRVTIGTSDENARFLEELWAFLNSGDRILI